MRSLHRSAAHDSISSSHRRRRLSLRHPPLPLPKEDNDDEDMAVITDPPWPEITPPPTIPTSPNEDHALLNHFRHQHRRNLKRQDDPSCDDVPNNVWSCAPTQGQIVVQNTTMHFVWNKNQPILNQQNLVDVYLFHEDLLEQATSKTHLQNQAGRVAFDVNDQWWDTRGVLFDGKNMSYPMYFVVVASGHTLTGGEPRGPTFTAIQTRVPDSILAQQIAASESASSASAAAAANSATASPSRSGGTSVPGATGGPNTANGSIQSPSGNNSLPAWAIALLVILGVMALIAFLMVFYLAIQRFRRGRNGSQNGSKPRPGSMGSATPIMADVTRGDSQREPLVSRDVTSPGLDSSSGHPYAQPSSGFGVAASPSKPRSISGSTTTRDTEGGLFSGADAAIMAAAFRDTLRKPDFADRPLEEGESPDNEGDDKDVLERELAEEGTGLRSVNSSRVRVHGDEGEMGTVRGPRREGNDAPTVDIG